MTATQQRSGGLPVRFVDATTRTVTAAGDSARLPRSGRIHGSVRDRFEDVAGDGIAVLRALGPSRVGLVGLSMGGMVAQELIRRPPDLVDRVLLARTGPQHCPGSRR